MTLVDTVMQLTNTGQYSDATSMIRDDSDEANGTLVDIKATNTALCEQNFTCPL